MQIARNVQPISGTVAVDEAVNFSLEANSKAFDILSSNLYQDKPEAIIRELSCNAYDSHIANGNGDEPFELGIPSRISPFLRIRDFGTGLSHEDMVGLYTTYFGSNKRDTNSLIGGLGLGSKTPFAYCDAFAVTSYYNGTARSYSVFKNEDGCPAITQTDERETDERNGLEIVVPVKESDFWTFDQRTKKVLKWFPVIPQGVSVDPVEWDIHKENYGLLKNSTRGYGLNNASLLMGNVNYSINGDAMQLEDDEKDRFESVLRNSGMVIFAEIGDVDIAASREALSYDKRSISKLKELISTIADELYADAVAQVEDEPTHWHKYQKIKQVGNQLGLKNSELHKEFGLNRNVTQDKLSRIHYLEWNKKNWKRDQKRIDLDQSAFKILYSKTPLHRYTQWLHHNSHVFEGQTVYFITGSISPWMFLFKEKIIPSSWLIRADKLDPPPAQIRTSSGTTVRVSKPVSLYARSTGSGLSLSDFYDESERSKQMMTYSSAVMSNELKSDVKYLLVNSFGTKHPWGKDWNALMEKYKAANHPNLALDEQILFIPKSVPKGVKKLLTDEHQTLDQWLDKKIADFELQKEVHGAVYDLFNQMRNHKQMERLIDEWKDKSISYDEFDPVDTMLKTYHYCSAYVKKHNLNNNHTGEHNYREQIDTMLGEIYLKYPWLSAWTLEKKAYWHHYKNDVSWEMFNAIRKECNNDE